MSHDTEFAGLTELDPGDPITVEGGAFTQKNPSRTDHYLRIGAVTHKHDAHVKLADPTQTVAGASAAQWPTGQVPADTQLFIAYTLDDKYGGETRRGPAATLTTPTGFAAPSAAITATFESTAGSLPVGQYAYALTLNDGGGGESTLGPAVFIQRPGGFASGEILLTGLAQELSNSGIGWASWNLWRATDGGAFEIVATNQVSDSFTDTGLICTDAARVPPNTMLNVAAHNAVFFALPTLADESGLASATALNVYISLDGSFTDQCFFASFPVASAGQAVEIDALVLHAGTPPNVSLASQGASQIDPDTDLLDWHWQRPVATPANLPLTGNSSADVRESKSPLALWSWNATANRWDLIVAASAGAGGGGTAFAVSDGTHTVLPPVKAVDFVNATVSDLGGGSARVLIPSSAVDTTAMHFKGDFCGSSAYVRNDVVRASGQTWVASQSTGGGGDGGTPVMTGSTSVGSNSTTTDTIPLPGTTSVGDVLLLAISNFAGPGPPTLPAGWTRINDLFNGNFYGIELTVYWKIATLSDIGGSVTLTGAFNPPWDAVVRSYRSAGVDHKGNQSTITADLPAPFVSNTDNNSLVVGFWATCSHDASAPALSFVGGAGRNVFTNSRVISSQCEGIGVEDWPRPLGGSFASDGDTFHTAGTSDAIVAIDVSLFPAAPPTSFDYNAWSLIAASGITGSGGGGGTANITVEGGTRVTPVADISFVASGAASVGVSDQGGGSARVTVYSPTTPSFVVDDSNTGGSALAGGLSAIPLEFVGSGAASAHVDSSGGSARVTITVPSLTGPQGAQGPPGASGAQGPPGASGAPGPMGASGAAGPQGPQGTGLGVNLAGSAGANPAIFGAETYIEFAGSGGTGVALQDLTGGSARILISASGVAGPQGPAGTQGPQGPQGAAGTGGGGGGVYAQASGAAPLGGFIDVGFTASASRQPSTVAVEDVGGGSARLTVGVSPMASAWSDDFSASDHLYGGSGTTLSISGGTLNPSDTTLKTPYASGLVLAEFVSSVKVTPGASVAANGQDISLTARFVDSSNYIFAQAFAGNNSTDIQIFLKRVITGSITTYNSKTLTGLKWQQGVPYWLRFIHKAAYMRLELWTQDPNTAPVSARPFGLVEGVTQNTDLSSLAAGPPGLRWTPDSNSASLDDFKIHQILP